MVNNDAVLAVAFIALLIGIGGLALSFRPGASSGCAVSCVTAITQGIHTFINSIGFVNSTSIGWDFNTGLNTIEAVFGQGNNQCSQHQYMVQVTVTIFSCKMPQLSDLSDYIKPQVLTSDTSPSVTQGTIAQSKGCQATSGSTNTCAFSNPVVAFNTLVVCIGSASNIGINTPTDTLGSTFQNSQSLTNAAISICYTGYPQTSGSDTISETTTNPSVNTGFCLYELNGVMGLDTLVGTGSASSASQSATSTAFIQHPVFIDMVSSSASQGTFTHGANFVTLATGNALINCQSSVSGVTTPTTWPSTTQNSVTWSEVAEAYQTETNLPSVTLAPNTNYVFTAQVWETEASSSSMGFGIHTLPSGATLEMACISGLSTSHTGFMNGCVFPAVTNTEIQGTITQTGGQLMVIGQINMGSTAGSLTIDIANFAQTGTMTIKQGSYTQPTPSLP